MVVSDATATTSGSQRLQQQRLLSDMGVINEVVGKTSGAKRVRFHDGPDYSAGVIGASSAAA